MIDEIKGEIEQLRKNNDIFSKVVIFIKDFLFRTKIILRHIYTYPKRRQSIIKFREKFSQNHQSNNKSKDKLNQDSIAMFCLLDDFFLPGFAVFVKSLLHHNPWINCDFVIVGNELSDQQKEWCKGLYPNIKFLEPNYKKYRGIDFSNVKKSHYKSFYKLELFRLTDYQKIISLDVDMLVVDDISHLFELDDRFAGVSCFSVNEGADEGTIDEVNGGLYIVGKELLDGSAYDELQELIHENSYRIPDEDAIYDLLNKRSIHPKLLHRSLNAKKDVFYVTDELLDFNPSETKIIHYVGEKPWGDELSWGKLCYYDLNKLWRQAKAELIPDVNNIAN